MIVMSMAEDGDSNHDRENLGNEFEALTMIVGESAREFIARAKGLARGKGYHGVDVPSNSEWSFLLGAFRSRGINMEALHTRQDGVNGNALAAGLGRTREVNEEDREVVTTLEMVVMEHMVGEAEMIVTTILPTATPAVFTAATTTTVP